MKSTSILLTLIASLCIIDSAFASSTPGLLLRRGKADNLAQAQGLIKPAPKVSSKLTCITKRGSSNRLYRRMYRKTETDEQLISRCNGPSADSSSQAAFDILGLSKETSTKDEIIAAYIAQDARLEKIMKDLLNCRTPNFSWEKEEHENDRDRISISQTNSWDAEHEALKYRNDVPAEDARKIAPTKAANHAGKKLKAAEIKQKYLKFDFAEAKQRQLKTGSDEAQTIINAGGTRIIRGVGSGFDFKQKSERDNYILDMSALSRFDPTTAALGEPIFIGYHGGPDAAKILEKGVFRPGTNDRSATLGRGGYFTHDIKTSKFHAGLAGAVVEA
jgi:hypothetical protein